MSYLNPQAWEQGAYSTETSMSHPSTQYSSYQTETLRQYIQLSDVYSHAPHNNVTVNGGPHTYTTYTSVVP
jgi:hypothetical protein